MKYISLILLLALFGCATPQMTKSYERSQPPTGKALVYIYRMHASVDSLNPDLPRIYADDALLGRLSLGGFYVAELSPGEHTIYYKTPLFGIPLPWKAQEVRLNAVAKETYFIKYVVDFHLMEGRTTRFEQVSREVGESEIRSTQLLKN